MTAINNIDYEKKFLSDFLVSVKYLKKRLGFKMERTGQLVDSLAKELEHESEALFFAGYYANIGLLMLENVINKPYYIDNEKELDLIKQHVFYSADFLEKRGFKQSAEIIKNHHEKPNGTGYFNIINKDKNIAIVNIADEFVGLASSNNIRPPYVKEVAIQMAMEAYSRTSIFTQTDTEKIRKILSNFYNHIQK